MPHLPSLMSVTLIGLSLSPSTAIAQIRKPAPTVTAPIAPTCPPDADRYAEWLRPRASSSAHEVVVADAAIHGVRKEERARAVALLESVDAVPLDDRAATELADGDIEPSRRHGRPFLVRNVVPDLIANLAGPARVVLVGQRLRISGGFFGCGGFRKEPVIVFLPTAPAGVDIQVSAIW